MAAMSRDYPQAVNAKSLPPTRSRVRGSGLGLAGLASQQIGDFLPPAFGHRFDGAFTGQNQPAV